MTEQAPPRKFKITMKKNIIDTRPSELLPISGNSQLISKPQIAQQPTPVMESKTHPITTATTTTLKTKSPDLCQAGKCKKKARFSTVEDMKASRCSSHKIAGMYEISSKFCKDPKCKKRPLFGEEGTKKGIFCGVHKKDGMVNVIGKHCQSPECTTTPSYGYLTNREKLFCFKHKDNDMVNVSRKCCTHSKCKETAIFGLEGYPERIYCNKHKATIMVNVSNFYKSKLCQYRVGGLCATRASYGPSGSKYAIRCKKHATPNMVNVTRKKCVCEECEDYVSYGIPGHPPIHCAKHMVAGEMSNPNTNCKDKGCKEKAIFGLTVAKHCEKHAIDGEVNIVQQRCHSCGLLDVLDSNGHCSTCDPSLFLKVRLAKQKAVKNFFDYHNVKYLTYDVTIDHGACGMERPDFVFDCNTHMLVIEIDENQHEYYPCECEQIRMINIGQALGMPTLFIRYNPDEYFPSVGVEETNPQNRMNMLKQQLEYWQKTRLPEGACHVTHLYYDGDNPGEWKSPIKLI